MADRRSVMAQRDMARNLHAKTVNARIPQKSTASIVNQHVFKKPVQRHICNNPNNPPCASCGTTIIPSPMAFLPLEDNPQITIANWTVSTRKRPILNSAELDDWENNKLKGLTLPEMIFGNSEVVIKNTDKNWSIKFNALDALKRVKLEDTGLRVSYANKWLNSKHKQKQNENFEIDDDSLKILHNYDWTYTTDYKGTVESSTDDYNFKLTKTDFLPLDKLSRPDKILFFDDMILFEDELADNGISVVNVKIRVMNERLLLLSRFFLRVDDVLLRVYDTRIYVEFDENKLIREYKQFEGTYDEVLSKNISPQSHDPKAVLRDSNWVATNTPLKFTETEIIQF